jgi:hypothetical protein
LGVFGANKFVPFDERAAICYGRGPGRGEDAFILDRELPLQVLASIVRAPGPQDLILFCVPFQRLFRGFVIHQPISFDHVQTSVCGVPNLSTMETGPTLNPTAPARKTHSCPLGHHYRRVLRT